MKFPGQATDPAVQQNFDLLAKWIHFSTGSPENVIAASQGAICLNTTGGASTTLYVKESGGSTNTGWIAK